MLKIRMNKTETEDRWTLHGQLTGPWVSQLRTVWRNTQGADEPRRCVFDLNDVMFLDKTGDKRLRTLGRTEPMAVKEAMSRPPNQPTKPIRQQQILSQAERRRDTVSSNVVNTQNKRAASIPLLRAFADKDDAELVAAAKSGDGRAFEVLVKRYQSRIRTIARRFTRVAEDSEDIAQQTFQKAFLHLQQFAGDSSFSTWLTRITINESLMWMRKKRAAREVPIETLSTETEHSLPLDPPDPGPSPEDRYSQREWKQILSRAMNELKPAIRTAIELRDLGELSTGATAGIMKVSVGAVKARLFHGRRKLRVKLKRYMESMSSQEIRQRRRAVRPRHSGAATVPVVRVIRVEA